MEWKKKRVHLRSQEKYRVSTQGLVVIKGAKEINKQPEILGIIIETITKRRNNERNLCMRVQDLNIDQKVSQNLFSYLKIRLSLILYPLNLYFIGYHP